MPEGPEIRREADAIAKVLLNQRLLDVYVEPARLSDYPSQLIDRTVVAVQK